MPRRSNTHQQGFALILSLLALVLLTTMGLALSNSTGVELQISTNQRWSESARYNSEAGIEYGRSLLMAQPDWGTILPVARAADAGGSWDGAAETSASAAAPGGNRGTRNFENWQCDERGYGMGYGVVIDDGGATGAEEYRSEIGGATLNGSFTLWVRRPVMWAGGSGTGTELRDYDEDDVLILVSEGVAPYTGASNTTAFAASNRAVYTIETLLARTGTQTLGQSPCTTRQGQAGSSASGGNTAGCVAMTGGADITEALRGVAGVGTGELK